MYIYTEYYSTHTYRILLNPYKEWHNAICSNMDGPGDDHTKWSKSDRNRQISYDVTYMQNVKKNDMNELIYKTERDSNLVNELMVISGKGWGER